MPAEDHPTVDRHLRFAENLQIHTEVIHGNNRAQTLVDYARKKSVTQLFLSRSARPQRHWFPGLDFTDQVLQQASEMEVTVVAERSRQGRADGPVSGAEYVLSHIQGAYEQTKNPSRMRAVQEDVLDL